ncbi:MAG: hypothetical protein Q7J10_06655, partial [Methanosarcinaceae archaeon]|nr:hypothetical protein [Methanosarcinaceae archaeon]
LFPPSGGAVHCYQTCRPNIQFTILKNANTPTFEDQNILNIRGAGTCRAHARVVAPYLADVMPPSIYYIVSIYLALGQYYLLNLYAVAFIFIFIVKTNRYAAVILPQGPSI